MSEEKSLTSRLPDDGLVSDVLNGLPGAAEELWTAYSRYLMRVAVALTHSPEEARELVQDALLAAFKNLKRYDPGRPFKPWIHRILVNKYRDWRRRWVIRVMRFSSLSDDGLLRSGEDIESGLRAEQLRVSSLECLRGIQRAVWALAVIAELETEEIAAVLGKKPVTIRSHLSKARMALKKKLILEKEDKK